MWNLLRLKLDRSERFPARDICFLGTMDQGSRQMPELLGRRRRRRRRPPGAAPRKEFLQVYMDLEVQEHAVGPPDMDMKVQ